MEEPIEYAFGVAAAADCALTYGVTVAVDDDAPVVADTYAFVDDAAYPLVTYELLVIDALPSIVFVALFFTRFGIQRSQRTTTTTTVSRHCEPRIARIDTRI